ncbi:MAG: hypothetical protein IJB17_04990 [Oscillospiraceae bacterium]|nr:hypothetical protein [Oscillospiraceae bacterium]
MKEFYLSSAAERIIGVVFTVIAVACMGILVFALRNDTMLLCVTALCCLLVSAGLIYYMISVLRGKCIADLTTKQLQVRGTRDYTLDLSTAVQLETLPFKGGRTVMRMLYFSDAEGKVVGKVPTLFTFNQGVMAEPMAMEMAKELGLNFQANLQPWEYDKEKRLEHEKEVAQQQKEEAKARREAKAKLRMEKLKKK